MLVMGINLTTMSCEYSNKEKNIEEKLHYGLRKFCIKHNFNK